MCINHISGAEGQGDQSFEGVNEGSQIKTSNQVQELPDISSFKKYKATIDAKFNYYTGSGWHVSTEEGKINYSQEYHLEERKDGYFIFELKLFFEKEFIDRWIAEGVLVKI